MATRKPRDSQLAIPRQDATVRISRLLKLLSAIRHQNSERPRRVEELAPLCDCSRSTLFRELRYLKEEQLIVSLGRKGYALSDRGYAFPQVPLTAEEALALALARALLTRPGLPMQSTIAAALDKAATGFSPSLQALFREAASGVHTSPTGRDYSHAPLPVLMQGWMDRTTVEMEYTSNKRGRIWRRLDPYQITAEGSQWMIHGWCALNNMFRSFALDSLHDARLTDEPFEWREAAWREFNEMEGVVLGWRGDSPIEVRVWFSPDVAGYALKPNRWPNGLQVKSQADDSALLIGTARGVDGILVELLRWRRHVVVLGGHELREAMITEIAEMQKNYEMSL